MSLRVKIILISIISMFLMLLISSIVIFVTNVKDSETTLKKYKNELIKYKKDELEFHTQIAFKAIEKFYNDSNDETIANTIKAIGEEFKKTLLNIYEANRAKMSEDELKNLIIQVTKAYRYNDGIGYFWINDFEPKMIMHPIVTKLDGQSLKDYKDPKGVYLFNEMIKVCKEKGLDL